MRAFHAYLFLASFLTTGNSWLLRTSHSNVIPALTDNVTLECSYDGRLNGAVRFSRLARIRLLKEASKGLKAPDWQMYAEVLHPNTNQPILKNPGTPGVTASGLIGQPGESYLSVMWSSASADTVGSYICEIDGFTVVFGESEKKYTEPVNITNRATSVSDFIGIIVQMRQKSDELSKELQSLNDQHRSQRQVLEKRIRNDVESVIEDNYFEVRYWPTGLYTMLTDAYGCPNTPFSQFTGGYMNVQTETRVHPQHVFPPRFNYTQCTNCGTRSVLRFDFCTSNRAEPRLLWPKGSYCIQRSGTTCTTGFNLGYTRFILESLVSLIVTQQNINVPIVPTVATKIIDLYFCCRNDGTAGTPIFLPTAKPFYLYRFGGTCQTVYNMDVSNVNVQIDTDDTKADLFSNTYHADGTINNGRLELCYYTKKKKST